MQSFLINSLGYSTPAADAFVQGGGTADTVLRWTKDKCPSAAVWARLSHRREELFKIKAREPLLKWADKWKAHDFLRRASLRELHWTTNENPYYPCVAYGVSYDACSDLSVPCSDEKRAHARVCDAIRRMNPRTSVTANGVVGSVPADHVDKDDGETALQCVPIDLTRHPLFSFDLEKTPLAELVKAGGLDGVAEMRRAMNGLRRVGDTYVRGEPSSRAKVLAAFIRDMLHD
jgi:hypothetical protein